MRGILLGLLVSFLPNSGVCQPSQAFLEVTPESYDTLVEAMRAVQITLKNGVQQIVWNLEPHDIRTLNYRAEIETRSGRVEDKNRVRLFKGHQSDNPESLVRVAVIIPETGKPLLRAYFADSASLLAAVSSPSAPRLLRKESLAKSELTKIVERSEFSRPKLDVVSEIQKESDLIEVATEADLAATERAKAEGISANAELLALLNAAEAFQKGTKKVVRVSYQHSWEIADPYRPPSLADQNLIFQQYWEQNFRSELWYSAAVLWTGRSHSPSVTKAFTFAGSIDSTHSYGVISIESRIEAAILNADQIDLLTGEAERAEWVKRFPVLRPYADRSKMPQLNAISISRKEAAKIIGSIFIVFFISSLGVLRLRRRKKPHLKIKEQIAYMNWQRGRSDPHDEPDIRKMKLFEQERLEQERLRDPDINQRLIMAGVYSLASRKRFRRIQTLLPIGVAVLWICTLIFASPTPEVIYGGMLCNVLSILLPTRWLNRRIENRKEEIRRDLPVFIEQINICLSSGLDIWSSVERVVDLHMSRNSIRPLTEVLIRGGSMMLTGVPASEAFEFVGQEAAVQELSHVLRFLTQCAHHGGEIRAQVQSLGEATLMQRQLQIEGKITALPVKATFPLFLIFAGFFGLLFAGLAVKTLQGFG